MLKSGGTADRDRLKEEQDRMAAIQQATGQAMGTDPNDSPDHQTVVNLRKAKSDADQDAILARTTYAGFAQSILGDPAKVAAVDRALRTAPFVADPQARLKTAQDALQVQQARLTEAKQQYMADHPLVRTIQSRIDEQTVSAVVAARQWQDLSEAHQQALAHSLADAQRVELEAEVNEAEYRRLDSDVKRIQAEQDAVSNRANQFELSKGAGAVNISVLDDPHADLVNVRPSRPRTLALAGLLGLLAGAGAACLRDWTDDRFRNVPAIRLAAGAPVLGAIPSIPASVAATAADRGQVVHFDPFGDASESYRTLRTALQFGLPPRTKTLAGHQRRPRRRQVDAGRRTWPSPWPRPASGCWSSTPTSARPSSTACSACPTGPAWPACSTGPTPWTGPSAAPACPGWTFSRPGRSRPTPPSC